jgi:hypothetical protein
MDTVIRYLTLFRTCWISGRYGGGKTALSIWLALQLVERGYANKIVTNTELTFAVPVDTLRAGQVHDIEDCAVILDEAWLLLPRGASNKQAQEWLAYLRKNNQHVILPSVLPLAQQVSNFIVERWFNGLALGVPLWGYSYQLRSAGIGKKQTEVGSLYWWRPSQVFELYDHKARPGDKYYVYEFQSEVPSGDKAK